jgi:hypothetical protein
MIPPKVTAQHFLQSQYKQNCIAGVTMLLCYYVTMLHVQYCTGLPHDIRLNDHNDVSTILLNHLSCGCL